MTKRDSRPRSKYDAPLFNLEQKNKTDESRNYYCQVHEGHKRVFFLCPFLSDRKFLFIKNDKSLHVTTVVSARMERGNNNNIPKIKSNYLWTHLNVGGGLPSPTHSNAAGVYNGAVVKRSGPADNMRGGSVCVSKRDDEMMINQFIILLLCVSWREWKSFALTFAVDSRKERIGRQLSNHKYKLQQPTAFISVFLIFRSPKTASEGYLNGGPGKKIAIIIFTIEFPFVAEKINIKNCAIASYWRLSYCVKAVSHYLYWPRYALNFSIHSPVYVTSMHSHTHTHTLCTYFICFSPAACCLRVYNRKYSEMLTVICTLVEHVACPIRETRYKPRYGYEFIGHLNSSDDGEWWVAGDDNGRHWRCAVVVAVVVVDGSRHWRWWWCFQFKVN